MEKVLDDFEDEFQDYDTKKLGDYEREFKQEQKEKKLGAMSDD